MPVQWVQTQVPVPGTGHQPSGLGPPAPPPPIPAQDQGPTVMPPVKAKILSAIKTPPKSQFANSVSTEKKAACKLWKIDYTLILQQACAEFYLLYDLFCDGLDDGLYAAHIDRIYPTIRGYTDMVVGGEIRHGRLPLSHAQDIAPALRLALASSRYPSDRTQAWRYWRTFRLRHGTVALRWVEDGFVRASPNGGAMCGPKWANITKTLRLHEEGILSQVAFLDTCWGLQHNGGIYFNKIFNTMYMEHVLEMGRKSKMDILFQYAGPVVQEKWKEKKGG